MRLLVLVVLVRTGSGKLTKRIELLELRAQLRVYNARHYSSQQVSPGLSSRIFTETPVERSLRMKRKRSMAAIIGLFVGAILFATAIRPLPAQNTGNTNGDDESRIQKGFAIAPVHLNPAFVITICVAGILSRERAN